MDTNGTKSKIHAAIDPLAFWRIYIGYFGGELVFKSFLGALCK